ncbi:MAG: HAMP domain-containing histidine kinase [Pedobacter sp.]|nr:MAG: HAMP domain-containing histidine kinase [Pedobacter sp.]
MSRLQNIEEYNVSNITQIIFSSIFVLISTIAIRNKKWKRTQRNFLTFAFTLFILTITFLISYIYSLHNTKNTLTVFLIGIVVISIFFSLEFKYIFFLSLSVVILFMIGMIVPSLNASQKLFNFIASIVLAFVLFICSRYSYFFKSQHFVQLKQLEEKNSEVQELNRQRGEILAFVAHDLRNPLNNIEALSRIIIEENESEESAEVTMILGSAKQAKAIINDLIEVIQVEKSAFQLQNINLVDYVASICKGWEANAENHRKINFLAHEKVLVSPVNPSKLNRVIDNLIGNGLKFSEVNKPIDVEVSKVENLCVIKIKDYGIGIPNHLRDMLFDQFSKAGRAGLRGEKSLGLGLHISKDIVEQHGGTLTMETEENKGSTFIIAMPLAS